MCKFGVSMPHSSGNCLQPAGVARRQERGPHPRHADPLLHHVGKNVGEKGAHTGSLSSLHHRTVPIEGDTWNAVFVRHEGNEQPDFVEADHDQVMAHLLDRLRRLGDDFLFHRPSDSIPDLDHEGSHNHGHRGHHVSQRHTSGADQTGRWRRGKWHEREFAYPGRDEPGAHTGLPIEPERSAKTRHQQRLDSEYHSHDGQKRSAGP